MEFGMRGHDLGGKQNFSDFIQKVTQNNINYIQLAFKKSLADIDFTYGNYSPGLANYIGQTLKDNNIHVSVLGCYINPTNPDENKRELELKTFIEHLKYAKAIGADMVGTETGRHDKDFKVVPYTYTEGNYQILLKSMRRIVDAAEKLGVMVGVEAVTTHTLYCPEMMKRFLEDINSPAVYVIFDPVNLIDENNYTEQEKMMDSCFEYYGDRIAVMHIKDFIIEDGNAKYAQIGEGMFNYKHLFTLLKKHKPYIHMLLENSNEKRYHSDCKFLNEIYNNI